MKTRTQAETEHIKASWAMSDAGVLVWARNTKRGKKIGDHVGLSTLPSGHINCFLQFLGELRGYSTGQIAWLLHYGEWPTSEVDHINTDPQNNKKDNLRLATRSEQCMNRVAGRKGRANKGVYKRDYGNKWSAQIWVDGICKNLGTYNSESEAAEVRELASQMLHGKFANTSSYATAL